eukprot:Opistho-2@19323
MCGITGFIDHNQQVTETNFNIAAAALAHNEGNGKHLIFEQKQHFSWGIANEQLATIDLSKKAQQPLTSSCGKYSITFNGTIYNFIALRETLIKYGVSFATLSDTEVILECYKKWGIQAFEKIRWLFCICYYRLETKPIGYCKGSIRQ